jgi:glycosyltransferase involved in cell wall biosynthesis
MKLSIVMAYHNRKNQLLKTLDSIHYFGNPEIIIVDDGSTERIDDIPDIKLIRIELKDKWWFNTCIPYNIGFSYAKGDVIIIQNPECIHVGDILKYSKKLTLGNLFSFAAYSLDYDLKYGKYDYKWIKKLISNEPQRCQIAHHGWYNHSIYRPVGYHFCNAVMRKDLKRIGGFDERYSKGIAYEDDEFLTRIKRAGINISIIDEPFVIHQKHARTDYFKFAQQHALNKKLYNEVTLKESIIKPPQNKYY